MKARVNIVDETVTMSLWDYQNLLDRLANTEDFAQHYKKQLQVSDRQIENLQYMQEMDAKPPLTPGYPEACVIITAPPEEDGEDCYSGCGCDDPEEETEDYEGNPLVRYPEW